MRDCQTSAAVLKTWRTWLRRPGLVSSSAALRRRPARGMALKELGAEAACDSGQSARLLFAGSKPALASWWPSIVAMGPRQAPRCGPIGVAMLPDTLFGLGRPRSGFPLHTGAARSGCGDACSRQRPCSRAAHEFGGPPHGAPPERQLAWRWVPEAIDACASYFAEAVGSPPTAPRRRDPGRPGAALLDRDGAWPRAAGPTSARSGLGMSGPNRLQQWVEGKKKKKKKTPPPSARPISPLETLCARLTSAAAPAPGLTGTTSALGRWPTIQVEAPACAIRSRTASGPSLKSRKTVARALPAAWDLLNPGHFAGITSGLFAFSPSQNPWNGRAS